jgi:hypothetical protein
VDVGDMLLAFSGFWGLFGKIDLNIFLVYYIE